MKCSTDTLQSFLDSQLEAAESDAVRRHLARCPACRQELSYLRLLYLELEQEEEIEVPMELSFIRQQAIAQTRAARREKTSGVGLWESQRLAWQPALTGVSQIPGPRQLLSLARATGKGLPSVIRGASSMLGKIIGRGTKS